MQFDFNGEGTLSEMKLFKLIPTIHKGMRIPYISDVGDSNQLPTPYQEIDYAITCTDEIPEFIEYRQIAIRHRLIKIEIRWYKNHAFAITTGKIKIAWLIGRVSRRSRDLRTTTLASYLLGDRDTCVR